ncbi:hypothetical protein [Paenibacillus sp. CF384]|uniref:hypothetical protein n=1 Tax=Paenibacillus sp. CF384 TaxID=1884382 RepID=UPI00089D81F0|nr:hypothetical protein [Paenibacillus sp. CF384]SDW85123.1 hypothetical protein SAMN05518855_10065 [Paenibacillus sp. CF384]
MTTLSMIKALALLIGMMNNTPTEVSVYTMMECPHEHCYDAINDTGDHCLFSETNFRQETRLNEGDKIFAIFLQNDEHRLVRVVKAEQ